MGPLPTNPLYLSAVPARSEPPTGPERAGEGSTVASPPVHSGPQKRIEKESNKKLTNELARLVGESFDEAAKPRVLVAAAYSAVRLTPPQGMSSRYP